MVDVLRWRADAHPHKSAYTFIYSEGDAQQLTFLQLVRRAGALAQRIRERTDDGDRILIVQQPGLDYIISLYACFFARRIAVPVVPPRVRRQRQMIRGICDDCRPTLILSDRESKPALDEIVGDYAGRTVDVNAFAGEEAPPPVSDLPQASDIALLQYTSGSTGQPKGVMLLHGNIIDNMERIRRRYGLGRRSRGVIWLPPYHDMGLGGGIFQPPYSEISVVLMAPAYALQRPSRWLRAITETRATISGGPPFAYAACTANISDEELEEFDLSTWACAFIGAEPVSPQVVFEFAARFRRCGFKRSFFMPSYGMAEATLIVASPPLGAGAALHPAPAANGPRVSCGPVVDAHEILIVDPQRHTLCADGVDGEIWIRGPSVAAGYWNDRKRSADVFGACLEDGSGPYLRTGDLGVMVGGELAVSGRMKNLVIVAGRKHHAEDIETTIRGIDGVRGGIAVFGAQISGMEYPVAMIETRRPGDHLATAALRRAIVAAIAREHDLMLQTVVFVAPGELPRTTSGKIRRHVCRDDYVRENSREGTPA